MVKIKQDFILSGNVNRPMTANSRKFITVHETANTAKGANAESHARYAKTIKGKTSWHYTVDDSVIYQHIPDNEKSYSTESRFANENSIAIEICVNADGNFAKAKQNAIWLIRELMIKYNIPLANVRSHQSWTGKNCPTNILRSGWEDFISEIKNYKSEEIDMSREELEQIVNGMLDAKAERIYHYWTDLPQWASAPIKALYDAKIFTGASPSDLNLSQTKMECLVVTARALKKAGIIDYEEE
jgi:hypothetical protein